MQTPTPAPSTSTPSTSARVPPPQPYPLPDSSQLQRIGEIFSILWSSDAPFAQQHQKSFQAVVTACEKGEWQKLSQATSLFKNLRDPAGATPFQACVEQGLTKTVQELLTRNLAEPLSSGEYTRALHTAARYGWKELVELLCKHVDINSKDHAGKTALLHAIEEGQGEVVGWLINQGAALLPFKQKLDQQELHLSPLAFAVMCGEIECVDVLIAKRMMPSQIVHGLGNLLHVAVRFGQHITLEHLLKSYPQQTRALIEGRDPEGRSPLSVAAYLGDLEAIAILTALQANASSPDTEQRTPMHWAALGRRKEAIELLYQAHASLNSVDANTQRPIDLIQGKDEPSRICRSLLANLQKGKQKQTLAKLSGIPPENLVLQGDGPREVYIGALQALRESNALQGIKRIAGTKEHTVLAALLAVGCHSQELSEKLAQMPQLTSLTQWLDEQITLHTKISHCTLGELSALVDQGKPCKHLHLLITLPRSRGCLHVSSEDSKWQDVVIADACALALAPPKFGQQLQIRCKGEDGACVIRKLSLDALYTKQPVALFDQQRYLSPWLAKEEKGSFPVYNKRTLAISVYKPTSYSSPLSSYNEYRTLEIAARVARSTASLANVGHKATRRFFEDRALSMEHYQRTGAVLFGLKNSNRHFVGRQEHLQWFEKKITNTSWDPSREALVCALYGPGGIGKSDLACTFANRYLDSFSLIAWINCETKETRVIAYRDLAEGPLRIPLTGKESPETVKKMVYRRLESWSSNKPWLLVCDNVEEKLELPQRGGCIVATSRENALWDLEERKQVQRFSPQEAVSLLEKTIGRKDSQLSELAKQLDNYPLALDIAGCYIAGQETTFTVQEYLEELKEHEGAHALLKGKGQRRYPRSLESAWQLTLSQLQKQNPQALDWLNLCAYFASEQIPQSWLQGWLHSKAQQAGPTLRREARDLLNALCSYGLVKRGVATFSIHRLMQETIQTHQKKPIDHYKAALAYLVKQGGGLNLDEPHTWDAGKAWLPHALGAIEHRLAQETKDSSFYHLHYQIGLSHRLLANFPSALSHYRQSAQQLSNISRVAFPHITAQSLSDIGFCYMGLGQAREALKYFVKALECRKFLWGNDNHPDVADSFNDIGMCLFELGQYANALKRQQQALKMREALYTSPHPRLATSYNNIGGCLVALDQCKEALTYLQRALKERNSIYANRPHPHTANTLDNIGACLNGLNRSQEAMNFQTQALEMRTQLYKNEPHPYIATSLNNLGTSYQHLGQNEKALDYFKKALVMQQKLHGNRPHPHTAISLNNVAVVSSDLGRNQDSLDYHLQYLEMLKKIHENKPHSSVVIALRYVAAALVDLKRTQEAVKRLWQALKMLQTIHGETTPHKDIAEVSQTLGSYLWDLGQKDEGLALQIHAMQVWAILFVNNPEERPTHAEGLRVANAQSKVGSLYSELGRHKEALAQHQSAHYVYKITSKNKPHRLVAFCLNNIGIALRGLGRTREAHSHFQQALSMCQTLQIPNTDPLMQSILPNLPQRNPQRPSSRLRRPLSPSATSIQDSRKGPPFSAASGQSKGQKKPRATSTSRRKEPKRIPSRVLGEKDRLIPASSTSGDSRCCNCTVQ